MEKKAELTQEKLLHFLSWLKNKGVYIKEKHWCDGYYVECDKLFDLTKKYIEMEKNGKKT